MDLEKPDVRASAPSAVAEHHEPDLRSLGRFVRERRQVLRLTQAQLAERLGWTQERVSTLENGRYGLPSLPALARLARGVDVGLSALIEAAGFEPPSSKDEQAASNPDTAAALFYTLGRLLAIEGTGVHHVLNQASDELVQVMAADKLDVFLADPARDCLVALGTSQTPMGRRQHELGLNHLSLTDGGTTVDAFNDEETVVVRDAREVDGELRGIIEGLGVRSMVHVPFWIEGQCRGVVSAASDQPNKFSEDEVLFLEAIARWIALLVHREELLQSERG
jgi:transcriptional regulator with XRE-family HTH domain